MEWGENDLRITPSDFIGCSTICGTCKYVKWNKELSIVLGCRNKRGLKSCVEQIARLLLIGSGVCENCTLVTESSKAVHCYCNIHRIKKKIGETYGK